MEKNLIACFEKDLPEDKVRYFIKDTLIEAIKAAVREKRNRIISQEHIDHLIDNKPYIIIKSEHHKKDEMRLWIHFDDYIDFIDVSILRFEAIPIGTISENNCVIPEDPKVTESKRPYPNGREWQEKVERKPVRKQYNFRKEVLEAYSFQCAVCSVSKPTFLDAAHILPAIKGNNDTVNNGICLCKNHHIAYDNNLLGIKPNGDIIVTEDSGIKVEFNKIEYPKNKQYYPSQENLTIKYNDFINKNK